MTQRCLPGPSSFKRAVPPSTLPVTTPQTVLSSPLPAGTPPASPSSIAGASPPTRPAALAGTLPAEAAPLPPAPALGLAAGCPAALPRLMGCCLPPAAGTPRRPPAAGTTGRPPAAGTTGRTRSALGASTSAGSTCIPFMIMEPLPCAPALLRGGGALGGGILGEGLAAPSMEIGGSKWSVSGCNTIMPTLGAISSSGAPRRARRPTEAIDEALLRAESESLETGDGDRRLWDAVVGMRYPGTLRGPAPRREPGGTSAGFCCIAVAKKSNGKVNLNSN